MNDLPKINVAGIGFTAVTLAEAVDAVCGRIGSGVKTAVVTPNAEIAHRARRDMELAASIAASDLVLPDGAGVVLLAKWRKTPLPERVAGADVVAALLPKLAEKGRSLYLLGSSEENVQEAAAQIDSTFPGIQIAGVDNGYYDDGKAVLARLNQAGADVVFVCLGSPRQENFIARHFGLFERGVFIALGGVIDILAGAQKRAPVWMRRCGLEWLYRCVKQPRRLLRVWRLPMYLAGGLLRRGK